MVGGFGGNYSPGYVPGYSERRRCGRCRIASSEMRPVKGRLYCPAQCVHVDPDELYRDKNGAECDQYKDWSIENGMPVKKPADHKV